MLSDREKAGLRGPVKLCTEESHSPQRDGNGNNPARSELITEYDSAGRRVAFRVNDSEGSQWSTLYEYATSGRLLGTVSGVEGKGSSETRYSYDQDGRLQSVTSDGQSDKTVLVRYDEHGRKTITSISRAEDYRPDVVIAGDPFEAAGRAPNLPGGGSATTIYDEQDRPFEIQVRNASGEPVSRALRTYDAQGRVIEEKSILDDLVSMFPPEKLAKQLGEASLSPDQFRQQLRAQLKDFLGGKDEMSSVHYQHDTAGNLIHTTRRIYNHTIEIEATYNDHGDLESERTERSTVASANVSSSPDPATSFFESRNSYKYDPHGNWTEKVVSYRSNPEAEFQTSLLTKRSLSYY